MKNVSGLADFSQHLFNAMDVHLTVDFGEVLNCDEKFKIAV
ncbi:MAG: hypothetical protein Q8M29_00425 [Bacteroidota bacterium]|nr:hypothetical protein [Bacteroidota bacterium]